MSSTLGFSTIDGNKTDVKKENKDDRETPTKGRNRTIKKRPNKGKTFLNLINKKEDTDDNEVNNYNNIQNLHKFEKGGDVGNINEYKKYSLLNDDTKQVNTEQEMIKLGKEQQLKYMTENAPQNHNDDKYLKNELTGLVNQFMPYKDSQKNDTNGDELMRKLNYMIHLLEEQHDEKTGNVTEELILYTFLGIFVIFIVDCFAKTAKYKR
jgi:hypothetical protein